MNKKLKKALFVGALILGTTTTFTACSQKNYDDDIANLQAQIDANLKKINEINTLVTSGSVISSTTTTTNGVKITLSNGTSFDIVNGTNGKDGTVWSIGTDGYWYQNGTKTNYYALGTNGTNGTNGKDGIYYVPNAQTGCFDIYNADGTFKQATTISYLPTGTITAVDDGADITLSGVSGTTGPIVIAKTNHLRGLVFIPQLYVGGVAAIKYYSFNYNTQKTSILDDPNEKWINDKDGTPINRIGTAQYHVNPSNVNENYVKNNLSFITDDNVESRSLSTGLVVTPTYPTSGGLSSDGILTVNVKVDGTPADGDHISMVALHINPKYSNSSTEEIEGITSDYARIYKESLENIAISDIKSDVQRGSDHHYAFQVPTGYFRYRTLISTTDVNAAISDIVWDQTPTAADGCDYKVPYNSSLNLNEYAGIVYGTSKTLLGKEEMKALNLSLSFEAVKNYTLGSGTSTDQANFIANPSSTGGIIIPQFGGKTSTACIGRTPIIRVKLMHGSEIVKVSYIKIKIVSKIDDNTTYAFKEGGMGNFDLSTQACGTESITLTSDVTSMNEMYDSWEYSNEDFTNTYEFKGVDETKTPAVGTVAFIDDGTSTHTHIFTWKLSKEEIIANQNKTISQTVKFINKGDNSDIRYATFSAKVIGEGKYEFTATDNYQTQYWNGSQCYFNTAVPNVGAMNPQNCTIEGISLMSLFKNTDKIIKSDDIIHFYFTDDQSSPISAYKLTVSDDKTKLIVNNDVIATISNDNKITYNKASAIAQELINTGNMSAMIGAKVYVCGDPNRGVDLSFNGDGIKSFQANFQRPINLSEYTGSGFIDGVDYPAAGSYIALKDLINPTDWRKSSFADNSNYWFYYGLSGITVDINNSYLSTNKDGSNPTKYSDAQILLTQHSSLINDYLIYHNNGKTVVTKFYIFAKVSVKYTWGTIENNIVIPVLPHQ